jgi:uncharacterized protein YqeY
MGLQEQIKKDLMAAMKDRDEEKKSVLRIVMGEFGRQTEKELGDDAVIAILKKMIKSEKEVLERKGGGENSSYIEVIEAYLPQMASEQEIAAWIAENIDFAQFKNKMQAMGKIMGHFGAAADGNTVKKVLQDMNTSS